MKASAILFIGGVLLILGVAAFVLIFFPSSESLVNPTSQFIFAVFDPLPSVLGFLGVAVPSVKIILPTAYCCAGAFMVLIGLADRHR